MFNSETLSTKLRFIYNFAARVISGRRKFDHISDVLLELEWLNAQQFIDYSDLCMLKRLLDMGQTSPLAANLQFNRDVLQRETRQSGCLAMMRPRTNHGRRNFIYRASLLYNNLFVSLGNFPEMSYMVFLTGAVERGLALTRSGGGVLKCPPP